MSDFRMPSLGSDMEAGTLTKWRFAKGDHVRRGDVIAEVETDKGIIEVEVFTNGTIEKLLVDPGTKVPVGTPLAAIHDDAPTAVPARAPSAAPAFAPPPVVTAPPPSYAPKPQAARASPYARKRAQELGIDLSTVVPSRPGVISVEDIERAVALRAPPPEGRALAEPAAPDKRMRRAIAATMSRAKREIPHFYLSHTVDFGTALEWIDAQNASRGIESRIVPAALLVRAVARAARKFPELNARWTGEEVVTIAEINVGVAISLRNGGLVAPAIHAADGLSVDAIMQALTDVTTRARAGTLRSSEMSDATITITSLGDRGVDVVYPIVFPPQVAMVGAGTIRTRPFVVGGSVVARPLCELTLAVDHRVTDGHRAGRFLRAMEELLTHPEAS